MYRSAARALGVLLVAASVVLTVPSQAAPARDRQVSPRFARVGDQPPALVGPQRRAIYSEVGERDGRLVLRGDVEDYSRRLVIIQRKKCDDCRWQRHDVVRTNLRGRFHSLIGAPGRGSAFWRAKVRASGPYARSYSATWETYY